MNDADHREDPGHWIEHITGSGRYFNCTSRERIIFEAGIKLGTIYHQFTGTPLSKRSLPNLEHAIEDAISVQPYVESITVRINWDGPDSGDITAPRVVTYTSLTAGMLDARVVLNDGRIRVTARMRQVDELNYPLMYIESIESI